MTREQYDRLTIRAARERDAEIIAGLTAWPAYVPEWDEYACRSALTGDVYYGASARQALSRMVEAEEIWARHLVAP